ncbi:heparinase II/III domain-containing protein [Parahaliea mediterranea]|uniref:Heparinase II/III family protein n=1 Tax=Parahaliea mediterranea TaxID=651086 RepID=A0A939DH91_9GAMM|nr:heparinase II/III family protein [Parahaliea mediterranea]MBN7797442.1 heparinase II/III family protein [Parahaliea mediterranea]
MASGLNRRHLYLLLAIALASAAGALLLASWHLSLTPRFLLAESLRRWTTIDTLPDWLRAGDAYPDHRLDGVLRPAHPRLLPIPDGAPAIPPPNEAACDGHRAAPRSLCWLLSGDRESAELALASMAGHTGTELRPPPTAWEWALAMDWLATLPSRDPRQWRAARERTLQMALSSLEKLDDQSLSLWHGRASEAANSWLLAAGIATDAAADAELLRRSQAHFDRVIAALAITESWPSGYNYWINSRAMPLVLALISYRNSLEGNARASQIDALLERLGLWMIHSVRPDNQVQGHADEGPRLDLRDETARVIDLLVRHTRSPVLASYGAYLQSLHGDAAYYRGYRWSRRLLHDPSVPLLPGHTGSAKQAADLSIFNGHLPTAALFGRGAVNSLFARSDWGPDATFVSFRASHGFSHHQHYDAGHFTLYKGGPLAVNGSAYGATHSPHRLQYSIQTVAKNSLLLPGRPLALNTRLRGQASDSGGQRLTMPTGSRIRDPEHWRGQLHAGMHLAAAELEAYDHRPGAHAYLRADLSQAYWAEPGSRRVRRDFLYLLDEDLLVIHDALVGLPADIRPAWLLHTARRPAIEGLGRVAGSDRAGVFVGTVDHARVEAGRGSMDAGFHLPASAEITLVGGPGYEWATPERDGFYVNRDGGVRAMAGYDPARWRLEARPPRAGDTHFLVSLLPSLKGHRNRETTLPERQPKGGHVLHTPRRLLVFLDGGQLTTTLSLDGGHRELLLLGVGAAARIELTNTQGRTLTGRRGDGVASFDLDGLSGNWRLSATQAAQGDT